MPKSPKRVYKVEFEFHCDVTEKIAKKLIPTSIAWALSVTGSTIQNLKIKRVK